MLQIFEKDVRGGVIQAVERHTKANDKYTNAQYNTDEKGTYLQYLNTNNLYGQTIIKNLPTLGFHCTKLLILPQKKKINL